MNRAFLFCELNQVKPLALLPLFVFLALMLSSVLYQTLQELQ